MLSFFDLFLGYFISPLCRIEYYTIGGRGAGRATCASGWANWIHYSRLRTDMPNEDTMTLEINNLDSLYILDSLNLYTSFIIFITASVHCNPTVDLT